jgi:hypothetical protein
VQGPLMSHRTLSPEHEETPRSERAGQAVQSSDPHAKSHTGPAGCPASPSGSSRSARKRGTRQGAIQIA